MSNHYTVYFLITGLLISCNNQPKNIEDLYADVDSLIQNVVPIDLSENPTNSISFERTETYYEGSNIIEVDENERVYLGSTQRITVFSSDGEEIGIVGSRGSGPGEFRSISAVTPILSSSYIFALAPDLNRINVYSKETLEVIDAILLSPDLWINIEDLQGATPFGIHAKNDSTLLLGFRNRQAEIRSNQTQFISYYSYDITNKKLNENKVFEYRDTNQYQGIGVPGFSLFTQPRVPYYRHAIVAFPRNGNIYSAWSEDILIQVLNNNGVLLYSFNAPYERSSLIKEDIFELYSHDQRQLDAVKEYDIPEIWPSMDQLLVDDENRLWISTITDDEENYSWWVISDEGSLIAKFKWPGKKLERHVAYRQILKIDQDNLYVYEVDELNYNRQVIKYRFTLN